MLKDVKGLGRVRPGYLIDQHRREHDDSVVLMESGEVDDVAQHLAIAIRSLLDRASDILTLVAESVKRRDGSTTQKH
jgi:hypothetical protein